MYCLLYYVPYYILYISLGHPLYANTERFHIFSDFSQLLA